MKKLLSIPLLVAISSLAFKNGGKIAVGAILSAELTKEVKAQYLTKEEADTYYKSILYTPTISAVEVSGTPYLRVDDLNNYENSVYVWNMIQSKPDFCGVAINCNYNQLNGTPFIPTLSYGMHNNFGDYSVDTGAVHGIMSKDRANIAISNMTTSIAGISSDMSSKQNSLSGTGFVKISGTTISYDNSSYYLNSNPSGYISSVPAQSFSSLTGKPTTLSGYGITDAYPLSGNPSGFLTSVPAQSFASLTGKPTILSGYGITDAYPLSGNPSSFITQSGARNAISLTTTGTSGAATYNSGTGVLNVPQYSFGGVTSIGLSSTDFAVSGSPVTTSGNITANLNTTGVSAGNYDWVTVDTKGRVTAGGYMSVPSPIAAGTRSFNTAYQISTTVYSKVSLGVSISCNLSLTGGQAGTVLLEISPNGSTGWIAITPVSNSNLGSLTIGLNTTQTGGYQLITDLPPGYYYRLTTTNNTGTPTYSFTGGSVITY